MSHNETKCLAPLDFDSGGISNFFFLARRSRRITFRKLLEQRFAGILVDLFVAYQLPDFRLGPPSNDCNRSAVIHSILNATSSERKNKNICIGKHLDIGISMLDGFFGDVPINVAVLVKNIWIFVKRVSLLDPPGHMMFVAVPAHIDIVM